MTEKSVEQKTLDTLNALIAGGQFPKSLIKHGASGSKLDLAAIQQIHQQLQDYYSGKPVEPEPRYTLDGVS